MNDRQRIERAVAKYFDKNGIYPTTNEVATNLAMTVGVVKQTVDGSNSMSLAWTGPKPPGVSSMIVELNQGEL